MRLLAMPLDLAVQQAKVTTLTQLIQLAWYKKIQQTHLCNH
ncbi:MAG: hypothetical protein Rpha_2150 [Candidatus Ruthia sp. Apha_13_S6]|nr:hypothetical protein [Candidatus Ruthia sp. Apha_13_S6]